MTVTVVTVSTASVIISSSWSVLIRIVFRSKTVNLNQYISSREVESALVVNLEHLNSDDIANVYNVCNVLCALNIEL